jgi:hypothetical protein
MRTPLVIATAVLLAVALAVGVVSLGAVSAGGPPLEPITVNAPAVPGPEAPVDPGAAPPEPGAPPQQPAPGPVPRGPDGFVAPPPPVAGDDDDDGGRDGGVDDDD